MYFFWCCIFVLYFFWCCVNFMKIHEISTNILIFRCWVIFCMALETFFWVFRAWKIARWFFHATVRAALCCAVWREKNRKWNLWFRFFFGKMGWRLVHTVRRCWVLLGAFGCFWVLLGAYWSLWVLMGAFGCLWVLMGAFGCFWVLFGAICIQYIPFQYKLLRTYGC